MSCGGVDAKAVPCGDVIAGSTASGIITRLPMESLRAARPAPMRQYAHRAGALPEKRKDGRPVLLMRRYPSEAIFSPIRVGQHARMRRSV